MPLQATSGAASYDAFGGGAAAVPNYIEDVFSTWLYTGNDTSTTINNGIDLAGKGGLVWVKPRNTSTYNNHILVDTVRGANYRLFLPPIIGEDFSGSINTFSSTGFRVDGVDTNDSTQNYASWTWRKQPKYFDVQTWTGSGANRTISHALNSVPACIFVKRTDTDGAWQVYHRSLANTEYLVLNTTAAKATGTTRWNSTTPTSTVFSLGTDATVNASGGTYVAYIFAHDAGGFGLTGTDNVISCGGFTTDSGGLATVTLGYEPQWLMVKRTGTTGDWQIMDTMRGFVNNSSGGDAVLKANSSDAESTFTLATPTSTGFLIDGNAANAPIIYIAIRRGPMKVPTSGTSVFAPITWTGSGTNSRVITGAGFTPDMFFLNTRNNTNNYWNNYDRLRGVGQALRSYSTSAETSGINYGMSSFGMDGHTLGDSDGGSGGYNQSSILAFATYFKRAPSFFDVVCYLGTGSATTKNHNLGVVPELMIVKNRTTSNDWVIYSATLGANKFLYFRNFSEQAIGDELWNSTTPTSSVFSIGTYGNVNTSAENYVAYLFATCAGVSKVGSYTGNGSSQTINCGFTAGARFVLIKRTDSTGDWMVADSARGIIAGSDPYLELNNTNAEVTGEDWLDTDSTGFVVNEVSGSNANTSSATYIFLAIA